MDRSFIIQAQMKEGGAMKDVIAVVFMNSPPGSALLGDLGLAAVKSVEEVRPLSKLPTEPTMYVYGSAGSGIEIVRFDWSGKLVGTARADNGKPHELIPPVGGEAADRLLYLPSAYVISAHVREGRVPKPVVGVLLAKPAPGKKPLKPDKKTLDKAGFVNIQSVDTVACVGPVASDTLYLFEKAPQPSSVKVFDLLPDGSVLGARTMCGEPRDIIPLLRGAAADRHLYGQSGLSRSDFPRQPPLAPQPGSSTPKRRC